MDKDTTRPVGRYETITRPARPEITHFDSSEVDADEWDRRYQPEPDGPSPEDEAADQAAEERRLAAVVLDHRYCPIVGECAAADGYRHSLEYVAGLPF